MIKITSKDELDFYYKETNINLYSKTVLSSKNIPIKVLVGVPFRDSGDRMRGFLSLREHFKQEFPSFHFEHFNNEQGDFNLSKSRNLAIKYALEKKYDVVVLNDADLFLNKDSLIRSILYSHKKKEITIPFSVAIHLDENGTELFYQKDKGCLSCFERVSGYIDNGLDSSYRPCGGVIIGPPSIFLDVGMYDENYYGWGHEDVDFHFSYERKYGRKFHRVSGMGVALHNKQVEKGNHNIPYYRNKNKDIFDRLKRH